MSFNIKSIRGIAAFSGGTVLSMLFSNAFAQLSGNMPAQHTESRQLVMPRVTMLELNLALAGLVVSAPTNVPVGGQ